MNKKSESYTLPKSFKQAPLSPAPEIKDISSKKLIRDLGLKVTQQRLQILEAVRNGPMHFTAQEIYEIIVSDFPGIGFATVYRFLKKMSSQGYVTEVRMGGMPARYEWASKQHHDHITCIRCGVVVEFENDNIEKLQEKVAHNLGFTLTNHILELFGTCPKCQA